MKEIIAPIERELIKSELTPDKLICKTNLGENYIYVLDAHNAPNTMREIGRLREMTFRDASGGTGEEVDIDLYDTAEVPFKQMIVWNEQEQEILSAYRYILGRDVPLDENGYPHTPTSKLFCFSDTFIKTIWQNTIELGRSFVQTKYQASAGRKLGFYALDNVWDGLAALTMHYPDMQYFFGKMTMYNSYNRLARNMILNFLNKHFKGDLNLVHPFKPVQLDTKVLRAIFTNDTYAEDFKVLNKNIRDLKVSIPPLIKTYMSLSSSMQSFGASANEEFGPVEEIAILIKIADIYENKSSRHLQAYINKL